MQTVWIECQNPKTRIKRNWPIKNLCLRKYQYKATLKKWRLNTIIDQTLKRN